VRIDRRSGVDDHRAACRRRSSHRGATPTGDVRHQEHGFDEDGLAAAVQRDDDVARRLIHGDQGAFGAFVFLFRHGRSFSGMLDDRAPGLGRGRQVGRPRGPSRSRR
jgi:hypothetical protein